MNITVTIIPTNLVTNSLLSLFILSYKVVALYFKGMPKSIDFCKRIFLYVKPALIIVPC